MKPILYLCALALVCGTNALAQAATVHVAQRLRSIECPKEIAKSGDDVRFGAMVPLSGLARQPRMVSACQAMPERRYCWPPRHLRAEKTGVTAAVWLFSMR